MRFGDDSQAVHALEFDICFRCASGSYKVVLIDLNFNSLTAKCTFVCNYCTPRSPPSAHLCEHVFENQLVSHGYALCAPKCPKDMEL